MLTNCIDNTLNVCHHTRMKTINELQALEKWHVGDAVTITFVTAKRPDPYSPVTQTKPGIIERITDEPVTMLGVKVKGRIYVNDGCIYDICGLAVNPPKFKKYQRTIRLTTFRPYKNKE